VLEPDVRSIVEVVYANDVVTVSQQELGDVPTYESGTTDHQYMQ
jgi:hypothetical protein